MPVERIQANPQVRNNGKVALQRVLVYCLEEVDNSFFNGHCLPKVQFSTQFESDLLNGIVTITAEAA